MLRIHIVDSDSRRRAEVARIAFALPGHAEIYESYEEFLALSPRKGIVLAADPGAANGLTRIQAANIYLPAVVYGYEPSTREIVAAMNVGAIDYLDWPFAADTLAPALREAQTVGRRRMIESRAISVARQLVARLSPREHQVLAGLAGGKKNKEIARTLQISPRTVEIHRANLMTKLNAESAAEAIGIAMRAGLQDDTTKEVESGVVVPLRRRRY